MVYLIIATVLFSLSFGLIKQNLSTLPAEFVAFLRLFLAGVIFLPLFKIANIKKQSVALLIGIVQFGVMFLCFIKAFNYLQGNEIAILTTSTPLFVGIWAVLFGEKFKPVYVLCILLSILGAIIILWQNISFDFIVKGILLMETSNCAFALGQVLWKKYIGNLGNNYIATAYFGAALFVLPFLVFGVDVNKISLTTVQILSILYLAILPTGVGFFLWNKGASLVKYSTLAVMNNLKIPLGVLFSILIFGEKISVVNFLIGSFVILAAILILYFSQREK